MSDVCTLFDTTVEPHWCERDEEGLTLYLVDYSDWLMLRVSVRDSSTRVEVHGRRDEANGLQQLYVVWCPQSSRGCSLAE